MILFLISMHLYCTDCEPVLLLCICSEDVAETSGFISEDVILILLVPIEGMSRCSHQQIVLNNYI